MKHLKKSRIAAKHISIVDRVPDTSQESRGYFRAWIDRPLVPVVVKVK